MLERVEFTQDLGGRSLSAKISLMGAYATGKTTLVRGSLGLKLEPGWKSTARVEVHRGWTCYRSKTSSSELLELQIWDHPGFDQYTQHNWGHLGGHGIIYVADGTRPHTIRLALALAQEMQERYGPLPSVLAVNKADLHESQQWQTPADLCANMPVLWTSAQSPASLEPALMNVVGQAMTAGQLPPHKGLVPQNSIQHFSCCTT